MNEWMRRIDNPLGIQTFTEEYDITLRQNRLWTWQQPIASITSIKNDRDWEWGTADALVDGDDYHHDPKTGAIFFDYILDHGFRSLQIVYDAGLGVDSDALIAAAPDIAHAADLTVVNEWMRKKSPGATGRTQGTSKQVWEGEIKFPRRAEELIAPYRNRQLY